MFICSVGDRSRTFQQYLYFPATVICLYLISFWPFPTFFIYKRCPSFCWIPELLARIISKMASLSSSEFPSANFKYRSWNGKSFQVSTSKLYKNIYSVYLRLKDWDEKYIGKNIACTLYIDSHPNSIPVFSLICSSAWKHAFIKFASSIYYIDCPPKKTAIVGFFRA